MIYQKLILRIILRLVLLKIKKIGISPTTNAADENFEARAETTYGGQKTKFNISVSDLLCETTYLLMIKRHEFHGSKPEMLCPACL